MKSFHRFYTIFILSGRIGGEQQRSGRVRDSCGAASQGEAGEAVSSEEDQACGYDNTLTAGRLNIATWLGEGNDHKIYR